ncbi:hypothetical protein AX16_009250 [Volvariella volvacea WC 439]|nr:hypothetical protein AX16_009250 [Volvariella volvacea WC 439]
MDQDLIKLVNKLQDTFANLGGELDMPQLVVVGSQSAGKSSVLETIVGRDFLPRGQGIVTRRPLILQLIHTPVPTEPSLSNPPYTEWGQFLHIDKRFTDFNEIRREIEQETFRVAGQNKGISKLPISLRIYSPNVLDLTLVDLPGLTKIPVGDQPSDIERQIRNLVLEYISKPNSVILAVSPANVDLANSESLKLARSVDPQGRRTIGVLTKLDLMDAGTNALDVLTGRVYPLKLGFIGVVNRSQQDINSEKPLKDALDSETEFFRNHPAYRNISHKNGTKYLAKTLNQVLMNHIRDKLPDMKARLNTLMGQAQQELNSFGDAAIFGDSNQQGALVLRLMTQFARDFVASIEGTKVDISTKELSGGARIYYIFNDIFGQALASIDSTAGLGDQDIRTAIRNSTGPRPSLFVPEIAFDLLVKPQIKLLEAPSLRCVELVYEELVKICHNCTNAELQRFPRLHAQLIETVSELLRERLGPTTEYAQSLIEIQAAYINTNHPAFIAGSAMITQQASVLPSRQQLPPRPTSTEPLNGRSPSSESEDLSEETVASNGRSVSSTIHDRPSSHRSSLGAASSSTSHSHSHGHGHGGIASSSSTPNPSASGLGSPSPHLGTGAGLHSNGGSSSSLGSVNGFGGPHGHGGSNKDARDTFLNYLFGQAQPPSSTPTSSSTSHRSSLTSSAFTSTTTSTTLTAVAPSTTASTGLVNQHPTLGIGASVQPYPGVVPIGRDVSQAVDGGSVGMGGFMLGATGTGGKNGSNAAFDMKSLGKHIEAVPAEGPHLSHREELETTLIRSLIASYFNIIRQSIQDLIPKAIMHFLVNHTSHQVQNRLVSSLYKPELFEGLLNEDEGLKQERERVKALLEAYREAFKTLSDVSLKST